MKKLIYLLVCLFIWQGQAQSPISKADWQDDLRYLQTKVHQDYDFLFKKTTAQAFDAEVEKLYKAIPKLEDHEILVGFGRITALFKYGHTRVSFHESPVPYQQLPIVLYQYKDGLHIQGVHKDYEIALGSKVLKIEGKPITSVLKAIYPVVPAENKQFFKAYAGLYLTVPEVLHAQGITKTLKNSISLTLEKDGAIFELAIKAMYKPDMPVKYGMLEAKGDWLQVREQSKTPHYLKHLDKIYYYEYLPEQKAVYVRHSQIQDDPSEDIPTFYAKLFDFIAQNEVEKLVLDVRLNGGGNNYKNKPIITEIIKADKINQPGKLFVIIGRRTFSACQNLVNELDNYTNAVFVGEPTSENINFYGDNRRVELPNTKLAVYLSFAWWQDKPQWENADWTAPHLAVDMSFEEYRTNQDPVLDKALNFDSKGFILNPMAHLTSLFEAQDLATLEADAKRMVKDPQYKFFDFEKEFNKVGYRLLGTDQKDAAVYVMQMNTKLFPESANCWDSLAEALWKTGDKATAKTYYEKAIALDPKGPTGDNARKMLKQMAKQ